MGPQDRNPSRRPSVGRAMPAPHTQTFATADGWLTLATSHAPDRRVSDRLQFVADHWAELAAAAWEGFQRHGAGAVVLWRDAAPTRWRRRPFEPERLWFATQLHVLPGVSSGTFDGWEAQQVEHYEPQRDAVVVFLEGGRVLGVHARGALTPPAARARAGAALN